MHKTPRDIIAKKAAGQKISVITAYDYSLATLCDKAGVDILLVGDSAGMVVLGYENTIPVTMTNMVMFTEAVSRARENALVVGDLPFMSYQANLSDAIKNSGKLIKSGADAVKLEGGIEMADTVEAIVETGIPVMGHIGLQPQTTMLSEGYRVQGKTADITIVDNVVRAINKLILECKSKKIRKTPFNNKKNLSACVLEIKKNLSRRMPHA